MSKKYVYTEKYTNLPVCGSSPNVWHVWSEEAWISCTEALTWLINVLVVKEAFSFHTHKV